jgi:superfamily II DNA or RNA helicase
MIFSHVKNGLWCVPGRDTDGLGDMPGVRYRSGRWYFGAESIGAVADRFGIAAPPLRDPEVEVPQWDRLRPYQHDLIRFIHSRGGRGFGLFDTGLGKGPAALVALQHKKRILVVTPSGGGDMLKMWADEIEKWVPGRPVTFVKDAPPHRQEGFFIVSMDQLKKVVHNYVHAEWFDGIIVDEAHNFKNYKAQRTDHLGQVLHHHSSAWVVMLTATPIGKDADDLFQQVHLTWPWAWGKPSDFRARYFDLETVNWGRGSSVRITGIRKAHRAELARRVAGLGIRATKQEWAHLLPPFTLETRWITARAPKVTEEMCRTEADIAYALSDDYLIDPKIRAASEFVAQRLADPNLTRYVVVTYHRKVAKQVYQRLVSTEGWDVTYIDGETASRDKAIERARKTPKSLLVVTMDSIMQGLNTLVEWTNGLLVELYYRPLNVIQMLGRFHRMTSASPVMFEVLLVKGSIDEVIYRVFADRMVDMNKVFAAGSIAEEIEKAVVSERASTLSEIQAWAKSLGHRSRPRDTYSLEEE